MRFKLTSGLLDPYVIWKRALPDVESFGLPDHFGDRRGTGIAQKHGVLGSVAEGRRKLASGGHGSSTED